MGLSQINKEETHFLLYQNNFELPRTAFQNTEER